MTQHTCPMHPEVVSDKPVQCPKCGMNLEKKNQDHSEHQSKEVKSTSGFYVCPMHPDVSSRESGECPKCGMRLEKQNGDEHGKHAQHEGMEQSFKKRFFISLPITLVVLVLSPKIQEWFSFSIDFPNREPVLFGLASFVVLWGGWPFFQMAKGEIKTRAYGMMTLVSLAVLSAYFFSVAATFFIPAESFYWEASTLVLAFLLGHWLEMRAVRGASGALAELAKLIPPTAHKIVGREVKEVGTEELKVGDRVLVRPGEKVPIDGTVVEGESSVNEAMISGESRPVFKKKGDKVIGGTINADGSLTVEVTKTGAETAVAQMMELIREAQGTKPAVQNLADRAARILTLTALIVGIGTFFFWFFVNPVTGLPAVFAATLAITVIVIACPHALGLAIPTVTTITTSLAAKNGILIRDMKAAEVARKVDYVVFDKTGTLTEGRFGVSEIITANNFSEDEVLKVVGSVEHSSQHSIAQGVVEEVRKRKIKYEEADKFQSFPGKGASGIVNNQRVLVGNKSLMGGNGIKGMEELTQKIKGKGLTYIFVAVENRLAGVITLEDVIREESKEAVAQLKNLGIKTAMLTGDTQEIAGSVAKKLKIDTVFAQVLPEDKVNKVKELQKEGHTVAMVGDGVNDAPSLTQAHVGIAIGTGTDVAVESAEIVLVKNDPRDVVKAIRLSQKTNSKMVQNLLWAAGYNVIAIPLAAGVAYPLGILLRPEWGALLMSASSVIVVLNALLLKRESLG